MDMPFLIKESQFWRSLSLDLMLGQMISQNLQTGVLIGLLTWSQLFENLKIENASLSLAPHTKGKRNDDFSSLLHLNYDVRELLLFFLIF